MKKELLPIGSVVLLKNATKKLMVTGVYQFKADENKLYDYIGVPYPEGFLSNSETYLFSNDDINDVIFEGYNNPERENFMEVMNMLVEAAGDDFSFMEEMVTETT